MPEKDQASTLIPLSYIQTVNMRIVNQLTMHNMISIFLSCGNTCDWFFIFTYNIVRSIHTATVACFLWLVDTVCTASLYCTYTHKLHIWFALTNMIMCFVLSLIATHPITTLSNTNYVVNLQTCWGKIYFHFTLMLVLDSWFLEEEETEPYKPIKSLPGDNTETTTWKVSPRKS